MMRLITTAHAFIAMLVSYQNAVVVISNNVIISNNKARPVLFSWCFRLDVCATVSIAPLDARCGFWWRSKEEDAFWFFFFKTLTPTLKFRPHTCSVVLTKFLAAHFLHAIDCGLTPIPND